jgi:uncharacterized membrane protein YhaH (DUF805 family)
MESRRISSGDIEPRRRGGRAPDSGGAREVRASIRHGFDNLLNFSGRDTRAQFWPYAVLLLVLHGAVAFLIIVPGVIFAALTLQRSGEFDPPIDPAVAPNFAPQAFALCIVAAVYFALIVAALARRRQDRDIIEAAGALSLPLIALVVALSPRLVPAIFSVVGLGVCLYALTRGGAPERIAAAMLVGGMLLSSVVIGMSHGDPAVLRTLMALLDIADFIVFAIVAVRANRFWPIWLTAFTGLSMCATLAALLDSERLEWVYLTAGSIWGYPMLVTILIGTRAHRIRLARDGEDPAWMPWRRAAG